MDRVDLEDWTRFVKAPSVSGSRDFYHLLMEPVSADQLAQVFAPVPQGDLLKPRVARLKSLVAGPPRFTGPDRPAQLKALVAEMLAEKRRLLTQMGKTELAQMIERAPWRWVTPEAFEEARAQDDAWVNGEVMTLLGDGFRDALGDYSLVISALMEAIYGMTRDYDRVWYVLAPLMSMPYAAEPVVRLWENRVGCLLTEAAVVLVDRAAAAS